MAMISALNAKTLTDIRHIGELQKSKNAVACLMCLARILREKKASDPKYADRFIRQYILDENIGNRRKSDVRSRAENIKIYRNGATEIREKNW